ncbi:MAG: hypothetical protein ABIP51_11285 [Bacteroidia bacterium]
MKKQSGIWIDGTKAIIVFNDNTQTVKTIQSAIENRVHHDKEGDKGSFQGGQHVSNEKKFEERKKHQINDFLNEVISHLKGSDELYVFGPAELKTHLKTAIEQDRFLAPGLKAVEAAEQMTENQIIAKVKEFYKQN